MSFDISFAESFAVELNTAPRKVVKSITKTVIPRLREQPNIGDPPAVKKLHGGWKNFWRYRIGDRRLIYQVNESDNEVVLLMLGHRKDVYDRLGHNEETGPTIRIIANPVSHKLVDRKPGPEEQAAAIIAIPDESRPHEPSGDVDAPLPRVLDRDELTSIKIPQKYHSDFARVRTEGELLALSNRISDEYIERVMNYIWPPPIERVAEMPIRIFSTDKDIEELVSDEISLESLLLKLDDSQKPFVTQFESSTPSGPWMLKGGPGSGKSTVMLHCIRGLLEQGRGSLGLEGTQLKILFTTFTRSLVSAANHLIMSFDISDSDFLFQATNVDRIVPRHLPPEWQGIQVARSTGQTLPRLANQAIQECKKRDNNFRFTTGDHCCPVKG